MKSLMKRIGGDYLRLTSLSLKSNLYESLGLPTLVDGSQVQKKSVLFGSLICGMYLEKEKEDEMETLVYAWSKIKNKSKMADWLNKNDNMAGWAWTYTLKRFLNFDTRYGLIYLTLKMKKKRKMH